MLFERCTCSHCESINLTKNDCARDPPGVAAIAAPLDLCEKWTLAVERFRNDNTHYLNILVD